MTVNVAEFASRFDELAALVNAGTLIVVESSTQRVLLAAAPASAPPGAPPKLKREWKLGLSPGAMVMAEDFDAPLTEEQFLRGDF